MKIGELAQLARCGTETIRYYERIGLLPPPVRGDNNYRRYTEQHVEQLRFIRNCRSLDMTHEEIRALLDYSSAEPTPDCSPINDLIQEHLQHVTIRIQELQSLEKQLRDLYLQCQHPGHVSDCGILENLNKLPLEERSSQSHLG